MCKKHLCMIKWRYLSIADTHIISTRVWYIFDMFIQYRWRPLYGQARMLIPDHHIYIPWEAYLPAGPKIQIAKVLGWVTLAETNSLHPKMEGWNASFLLGQKAYFQGWTVSFREGSVRKCRYKLSADAKRTSLWRLESLVFFMIYMYIMNSQHGMIVVHPQILT